MPYKHGAHGDLYPSIGKSSVSATTLPVYFGTYPVHQLDLEDYSDYVNKPLKVSSYSDAEKLGYSTAWGKYTLCEAVDAHFNNQIQAIGPIILVNVLDPAVYKVAGTALLKRFVNKQIEIETTDIILSSVKLTDATGVDLYEKGINYSVSYNATGTKIIIKDIKGTITKEVTITFDEVTPSAVDEEDIIGGTDANTGEKTGISVIDMVYFATNMIPTLMAAPSWSHIATVANALKARAQKINGHWYAYAFSDITNTIATIPNAIEFKQTNGYTGANEKVNWPMAKKGELIYHLSTLAVVATQQIDFANDGVPYETPSNKPVDITGMVVYDNAVSSYKSISFDQQVANTLNEKGITTVTYWGGRWVLWGPHTAAYEYGKDLDVREKFDSNMRMLYYIVNDFQLRYGSRVDKPFNRALKDSTLNEFQEWLDKLVTKGALLLGRIEFLETSNSNSDLVEGDFSFDIASTVTPPAKSLSAKLRYTTEGLDLLMD